MVIVSMSNRCLNSKCIQCCKETNMLLTNQDIEKITKLGYDRPYFIQELNGWLQLKNSQGRCVFHTGDRCSIYQYRPEGCTLYPVVYDNDNHCAILDRECPQRQTFSLGKHHVQKLDALISTLRRERTQRKKSKINEK
jgi:Fe-S-cluster containining protein